MKKLFLLSFVIIFSVCGKRISKEENNKAREKFNKAKIQFMAMQDAFSQVKNLLNKRVAELPAEERGVLLLAIDNFLNNVITEDEFESSMGDLDIKAFIHAKKQLETANTDFTEAQKGIVEYAYLKKVKCVSLYDNMSFCSKYSNYCDCVNNCRANFTGLGYSTLGDCYNFCANRFGTSKWWYCGSCNTAMAEFSGLNCMEVLQN